MKLLVVDDEDDVRDSTAMLVRTLGYTAVTCGDAAQILDVVAREKPDLILQDLRMPGLNVSGLVAALRTDPATADIPLVFFSANSDLPTTAARYDVWGYLAKPFGASELAHLVDQVLSARTAQHIDMPARDVQREVRQAFHDYWNLLAAMGNYLTILNTIPGLPAETQRPVHGLEEILLKLESKTDRLRSYILSLAVPLGEGEEVPRQRGSSTSPKRDVKSDAAPSEAPDADDEGPGKKKRWSRPPGAGAA